MEAAERSSPERSFNFGSAYAILINASGILLLAWSVWRVSKSDNLLGLFILSILAGLATVAPTWYQFGKSDIVFEVGSAVVLAAVPHFGVSGAVFAITFSATAFWLNTVATRGIKGRVYLLFFNLGMQGIAVSVAAMFFRSIIAFTDSSILFWLAWLVTAIIFDQMNVCLLVINLYFQNQQTSLLTFWRENYWAMLLNILVLVFGGGVLAFAIESYGVWSILVFFLPILLSAFAFQLYSSKMKASLSEMELLIAERTRDLLTSNTDLRAAIAQVSEADREKDRANVELIKANRQLRAADEAKDRFLAVLSHDMRSPITGIMLYGQMLQKRPDLPLAKRQRMNQVILQNAQSLVDLVDDVVEVERLGNSELMLSREFFDLAALGAQIVSGFEAHAGEKQIEVVFDSAENPHVIEADQQLVKRAITNLVSNAIKYTPPEGTIRVNIHKTANRSIITVTDTGYGIPKADLPHIFDSYRRVRAHQDKAKGLGLGLSIVKSYIEAHEGTIEVDSTVGVGSCFKISLPLLV